MVWKLETSGNFRGNLAFFGMEKRVLIGEFERERKPGKSHLKETSRHFLAFEVSIGERPSAGIALLRSELPSNPGQ
jgi:hypothetical protein